MMIAIRDSFTQRINQHHFRIFCLTVFRYCVGEIVQSDIKLGDNPVDGFLAYRQTDDLAVIKNIWLGTNNITDRLVFQLQKPRALPWVKLRNFARIS